MRNLDYHFQLAGLAILVFTIQVAVFCNDAHAFLLIFCIMFGAYHILHYVMNAIIMIADDGKLKKHMIIYPIAVVTLFKYILPLAENVENPKFLPFLILGVLIGFYYFYQEHKKKFIKNFQ